MSPCHCSYCLSLVNPKVTSVCVFSVLICTLYMRDLIRLIYDYYRASTLYIHTKPNLIPLSHLNHRYLLLKAVKMDTVYYSTVCMYVHPSVTIVLIGTNGIYHSFSETVIDFIVDKPEGLGNWQEFFIMPVRNVFRILICLYCMCHGISWPMLTQSLIFTTLEIQSYLCNQKVALLVVEF